MTSEQNNPDRTSTFRDLGVSDDIADALEAEGIKEPFPIQSLALPLALNGSDIIGQARTGTGKTFAFGLPLLQRVAAEPGGKRAPRALVVVPTRELAIQVAADLTTAAKRSSARILTVYGGRAYEPQISALNSGVDIVVGTPGRLLDLENQRHLDLSAVDALVLDEADRMLDLGFLPDVERLLKLAPQRRQVMLFSATMPSEIAVLARNYLHRPTHVRASAEEDSERRISDVTEQHAFRTHPVNKVEMLALLLQAEERGLAMVFCHTKRACDKVAGVLADRGFAAAAVHGDLGQSQRERALRAFRNGKIDVLVATDVAARGLDVDDVTHVVNYECPDDAKTYVHRIGRTGRAGRQGIAVTFIDWQELARWKVISAELGSEAGEPPETYSTSEHFRTALRIPADATGKLTAAEQSGRAGLEAEEVEDIGETGRQASAPPAERRQQEKRPRNRKRTRSGTRSGRSASTAQSPSSGTEAEAAAPSSGNDRRRRQRRRLRGGVDVHRDSEH